MRWSGQAIGAEQTNALPSLGTLSNLVRSVQTPEFAGLTFHEVLAKSALNHVPGSSSSGSSNALPFAWTINPYRGCSHACVMCFARQTHTYLDFDAGRDFDAEIVVKVNVAEVLAKELARPSWQRHPVALGTNTDPYQRAEGRYRLMPGIIAALAASGTPFSILTKGTLLRRDIPMLQAAAERVPVELAMTIDIFDSDLRASVEPGAPTTEARLATVKAVRDAGLPCSVFLMPIFPYLTDSIEHLDRAFAAIAESGAESVEYSALHLKVGAREWFFSWLAREHPELLSKYGQLYPMRQVYPPAEYRAWLAKRVRPLLRKHGLERPPRIDPTTGSPMPRTIGRTRARAGVGDTMLANELAAAAAAGLQPTLF
jgi:DNA repair photolyase